MSNELPIVGVLPEIRAALGRQRSLVLIAPPGAGKSTRVPLELLGEPWVAGRRIVMLEPRRLATRAVAARMAATLGEPLGRTIGYRMRLDTRVSAATRIEVVTEGVLATLLQRDPALEDVACVIFDEFHERSLQADLGLALCIDVQANVNEGLRLLVMSATLAAEPVARLLGDAAVVQSVGRIHPVDVEYLDADARRGETQSGAVLARALVGAVRRALEREGDVLVFLPGAAEIRRAGEALGAAGLGRDLAIAPLYGDLGQSEQQRALEPAPAGMRKVVLATNIAETSLTIEGVRSVVDSGLERRSRFDPVSGMSRLETRRVSRASADQRTGRAGRVARGLALRLWSEATQRTLEAQTPAEILEADLAPLALELAGWNVADAAQLRWLDAPPAAALAQARELLARLGALDAAGRVTPHGRAMLELRMHPRLAHMMLRARDLELVPLACDLAALLGERDILRARSTERDADLRVRLDAVGDGRGTDDSIDRGGLERVRRSAGQFRRQMNVDARERSRGDDDDVGVLLTFAYPDRIAQARSAGSGRYLLSNGRGAIFAAPQALARQEFLVIPELDAGEREARIFLAAPITRGALERECAHDMTQEDSVHWDSRERAVSAVRVRRLGALVVESRALARPDSARVAQALLEGVRELSLAALPWDRDTREWQARVQFVRALPAEQNAAWPDVADAALTATLDSWLLPWLQGMSRADHLARLDLAAALESLLDWKLRQRLETLAPTHLPVPSGSHVRVEYQDGETPTLSARLQELFGWHETPRIGGGTVAVLIKLLSPARRPVQVTRDLASFWRTGYAEVRRELKGRYPKHYWPDDPLQAQAVRGTRR